MTNNEMQNMKQYRKTVGLSPNINDNNNSNSSNNISKIIIVQYNLINAICWENIEQQSCVIVI